MALVLSEVQHRFGERRVLRDISFTLPPGRLLAILGPNGAGKTTLLRLLCGILPVQQGRILLGARCPDPVGECSEWRRQVGLLTESPGLYDLLTVRENLELFARLQGMSATAARDCVNREAARVGLSGRLDTPCGTLSKGLRQRVALARAVLHEPHLLLLDEPTSGLDPESAETLRERLRGWRAEGRTLVMTTHDLHEAHALADQIIVLQQGMVALTVLPAGDLLSAYRAAIAQLGGAGDAAA